MCSIVGSFDRDKLIELCKANEYRGQQSHSISYFNKDTGEITIIRSLGSVNYDSIIIPERHYAIVHQQAPTSNKLSEENIHPASHDESFLWHNGIIKQAFVPVLQVMTNSVKTWDSELLLMAAAMDIENLSMIEGSFSCLLYTRGELYLFRNEISPMFYDANMTISSTKFDGAMPTDPNQLFFMDFFGKSLVGVAEFKTKENPYFL